MWATLETWLLGDGEVPQLRVGEILRHKGLRLNCAKLGPAEQTTAGIWTMGDAAEGDVGYRLRGPVVAAWEQAAVLDVNGSLILAEPAAVRPVPIADDNEALERYSPDFKPLATGTIAEAVGRLEVVPDYEWDAYHHVEARRDWLLAGIYLVRHHMVPVDPSNAAVTFGPAARVSAEDRLRAAAGAGGEHTYLVHLQDPEGAQETRS